MVVGKRVGEEGAEDHQALWGFTGDEFEICGWAEFDANVMRLTGLEDEIAGDEMEAAVMAFIEQDRSGMIQDEDFFGVKILSEPVAEVLESAIQESGCWCGRRDFYNWLRSLNDNLTNWSDYARCWRGYWLGYWLGYWNHFFCWLIGIDETDERGIVTWIAGYDWSLLDRTDEFFGELSDQCWVYPWINRIHSFLQ